MTTTATAQETSKENEMMVLGCMLTSNEALKTACTALEKYNFTFEEHQELFQLLKTMQANQNPIDVSIVCEELRAQNRLENIGGVQYIVTLAQYVGTSTHFEWYIDRIIEETAKKNLYDTIISCSNKSLEEIKQIVEKKLDGSIQRKTSVKTLYQHLLEPLSEQKVIEEIRETSQGVRVGIKVGGIDLELPGGAITIAAGPTSHGKTTLLINLAKGVLENNPEKSVYFFSYEESMSAILSLFLNTYMGKEVSKNNRRSIESFFREGSCKHIKEGCQNLFISDKNAFFEDPINNGRLIIHYSDMAAEQLVQAIRFIRKNRDDVGAIFIDYMQLLNPLNSGKLSRQEQLKHICLMLKDCAVETGLPIILGAQFNRQVTCEADLSPIYISEAGDIERIASLILGFWNRNFLGFSREGNQTKKGDVIKEPRDEIYLEVLKGRKIGNGHNTILNFNGNIGKIENSLTSMLTPCDEQVVCKLTR